MGLSNNVFGNIRENTLLVCVYDEGDCDTEFSHAWQMHRALYNLFQVNENLKEGDKFETEYGVFECVGVHVVPCFEMEPEPKKVNDFSDW